MSGLKQVIVMRKDLGMRKGKMIAQGAHASMKAVLENQDDSIVQSWLSQAFTKIVVSVSSDEELGLVLDQALEAGIICAEIIDSGRTEFDGVPTRTCIAVGPATHEDLQPVTGDLKLL